MIAGAWNRFVSFAGRLPGILAVTLVVFLLVQGCAPAAASRLKVVTGTSLLDYITREVGGDYVEVVNLIPPAQHPGNFDVKPGDLQKMNGASLLLLHGWPGEGYADKLVATAGTAELTVARVQINGNWMTAPVQSEAAGRVAALLGQVDAANASNYARAAEEYKQRVAAKEAEIREKLAGLDPGAVVSLSSDKQAGFLLWLGFKVAGTYGDAESLTPEIIKTVVDKGRAAGAGIVVDNLQSSPDAGKGVAEELEIKKVTLSNFPGGFEDTETWEKAIDRNVALIIEALSK